MLLSRPGGLAWEQEEGWNWGWTLIHRGFPRETSAFPPAAAARCQHLPEPTQNLLVYFV